MDNEQTGRRRTQAEAQQVLTEFLSSGMRQDEFCRNRGISRSTLYRYLSKNRRQEEPALGTQLVPVQLMSMHRPAIRRGAGLTVLLDNGRKIEVGEVFNAGTLERLLSVLERA